MDKQKFRMVVCSVTLQVWDLFQNKDEVREMIVSKIQEESLRTYLFTYSSVYDTLSLVTLADMFELDVYKVHSIISKMVINEELMVSFNYLYRICNLAFCPLSSNSLPKSSELVALCICSEFLLIFTTLKKTKI